MVTVSVIVPFHNPGPYLEACLDSVVVQTRGDMEVICVNDGSTDDSRAIVLRFMEKDPRVRLVDKEHAGPGAARNAGLGAAKGEYVAFVDADDRIAGDFCEKLLGAAVSASADIAVTTNVLVVREDGSSAPKNMGVRRTGRLDSMRQRGKMFTATSVLWNKVYRRAFLEENGIRCTEFNCVGEDNYLTIASVIAAGTIIVIDDAVYYYRETVGSRVNSRYTERQFRMLDVFREVFGFVEKRSFAPLTALCWKRFIYRRMRQNFRAIFEGMDETLRLRFLRAIRQRFPGLRFIPKSRRQRLGRRVVIPLLYTEDVYSGYSVVNILGARFVRCRASAAAASGAEKPAPRG